MLLDYIVERKRTPVHTIDPAVILFDIIAAGLFDKGASNDLLWTTEDRYHRTELQCFPTTRACTAQLEDVDRHSRTPSSHGGVESGQY